MGVPHYCPNTCRCIQEAEPPNTNYPWANNPLLNDFTEPWHTNHAPNPVREQNLSSAWLGTRTLGREMYFTLTQGHTVKSVISRYPDERSNIKMFPEGTTLRAGDVLTATCVYDSIGRGTPTGFGHSALDEHCVVILSFLANHGWNFECVGGQVWTGELDRDTPGFQAPLVHPWYTGRELAKPGPRGSIEPGLSGVCNTYFRPFLGLCHSQTGSDWHITSLDGYSDTCYYQLAWTSGGGVEFLGGKGRARSCRRSLEGTKQCLQQNDCTRSSQWPFYDHMYNATWALLSASAGPQCAAVPKRVAERYGAFQCTG